LISEQMDDDLTKVEKYVNEIRNVYTAIEAKPPATVAREAMAAM
jgi:hypothetical protein